MVIPLILIPVIAAVFCIFYRTYQNHQRDKEQRIRAEMAAETADKQDESTQQDLNKPLLTSAESETVVDSIVVEGVDEPAADEKADTSIQ